MNNVCKQCTNEQGSVGTEWEASFSGSASADVAMKRTEIQCWEHVPDGPQSEGDSQPG